MNTLKDSTQDFCKMFSIDLNAPLKARFVCIRDDIVCIDETVTVNITAKFYVVSNGTRFKRGKEKDDLLGFTVGKKGWNTKSKNSINYLYKIDN